MKPKSCPGSPIRRHTARGADRVDRLQSTAADMFLNCGYEGVSVDGLIGRVGGSRRNVWGLYGGKQGLFVAAVQDMCNEITAALAELPMAEAGARDGLMLYGQRLLAMVLQPRKLAIHRLMVSEGQRFPEQARALCTTGRDNAIAALTRWMAERQARGELRQGLDANELAQHFIHLIVSGPQVRALVGELPPGWTPEGIAGHVASAVELFLHGAATAVPPHVSPTKTATTTREPRA
jgi:AcrR family transcriptional regulator